MSLCPEATFVLQRPSKQDRDIVSGRTLTAALPGCNRFVLPREFIRIIGNRGLLVCRNDKDSDPAVVGADLRFCCLGLVIYRLVKLDAYLSHVAAYLAAQVHGVLSYSAREDHGVNHTEHGGVRTDVLFDAVAEDVDGQSRSLVTFFGKFHEVSHIVRGTGYPEQSAFLVAQRLQFAYVIALIPKIEEYCRIEVARTS